MEHAIVVTQAELDEIIDAKVNAAIVKFSKTAKEESPQASNLIYGIKGLAAFLNVSMVTAQKYKNDKLFPCIQRGRKVIFKSDEVLAGLSKRGRFCKI